MGCVQQFRIGARIHDLLQDNHADMSAALVDTSVKCVQLTLPKFGGRPTKITTVLD